MAQFCVLVSQAVNLRAYKIKYAVLRFVLAVLHQRSMHPSHRLSQELKSLKNQLRAERDEKRQMKERLKATFEHAKQLKTDHAAAVQREEAEIAYWRKTLRKVQDRHRDEVEALQTAVGAQAQQAQLRMNQVNSFGSRVMAELSDLHENLKGTSTDTRKVFDEEEISSPVFLTQ